ncbi:MAG: phosphoribosylamine--glycine ligase [Myxococcales bacterium]|nr:phosphoribosylamine--glycine ligase [Myxococcales bacterium]
MRVLLLGSGAREHALAWKLAQSPNLKWLCSAPGNPGTEGHNMPVTLNDADQVQRLAGEIEPDLIVVGPEAPLVAGLADQLMGMGFPVFGPTAAAARIEGSKAFAKEVMQQAGVPTAEARVFDSVEEAVSHARSLGNVVVKADGLAAGKGVVVAKGADEAEAAVRSLAALGPAGKRLLLEELLEGEEVSVIALCDGERYVLLPPAQDHKRVGDGDTGPNTGGMGAYSPVPFLDEAALRWTGEHVIGPTLSELSRRGTPFRGALYAGLMLTRGGPRVLEFNCRFGDPETQVLVLQLEEDLLPLLDECARGRLEPRPLRFRPGASVGVVLAAAGYPGAPRTGDPIEGLEEVGPKVRVFHGGTRREGVRLVTAGGRVLTVCASGQSLAAARERAYSGVARIRFPGSHHRRDIGARALGYRP